MKNWSDTDRAERPDSCSSADQRSCFAQDRDRILYSSNFRRLSGITQIVKADEGDVFHNRLTHSIKVAQLGRRLAERIIREQKVDASLWGVDPEVVEAACLAHDLGHPPFGHIGEEALNDFVLNGINIKGKVTKTDLDGFEGNAQTLRVISKLAIRYAHTDGLDLTRATLAACIKYPWKRDGLDPNKSKKWGVYSCDLDAFTFARGKFLGGISEVKTPEAELMDWADDMAYSVHDLEDFHRCNFIPWNIIFPLDGDKELVEGNKRLVESALKQWHNPPSDAEKRLNAAYERVFEMVRACLLNSFSLYEGTRQHRYEIRLLTSQLIGNAIKGIKLKEVSHFSVGDRTVIINSKREDEIRLLKQITRDHITGAPALAAQQRGYWNILETLYREIYSLIDEKKPLNFLPKKFEHIVEPSKGVTKPRMVADIISSLSENEVVSLYARLTGRFSGSILDPIVR